MYCEEFNSTTIAYAGMQKASKAFGINISEPDWLELTYDEAYKPTGYLSNLDDHIPKKFLSNKLSAFIKA